MIIVMKTVTFFFLMCTYTTSAQVKVNEIKMKIGSEFHKAKEPDVVFPVISTNNKVVDDKINFHAIKVLTADDSTTDISKTLFRSMNEGLAELDYAITLKTNDILSYRLDARGCGAYCSSYSIYLNFDLQTGEPLKLEDVINSKDLDSFRSMVLRDKIKALKLEVKEKDSLLSEGTIDSSEYNFVLEHILRCMSEVNTDRFLLLKNEMQIVDPCELPHVMQALQPVYELEYSYKRITKFIKPVFLEKMKLTPH